MTTGDKRRIFAAALAIGSVMACFCALTPWIYDDFGYGAGDSSLGGILSAQVHEHLTWSGKFIGHFFARCLLHGPSWLHPVLTPLVFLGLVFSGVLLVLGPDWRDKLRAWHLIVLAGLTWFALPAFGTVFFWRTGTADYGWMLTFAVAFLVPYRFWLERGNFSLSPGIFYVLPGIVAGWSNENVGMLAILAALGVCLCRYKTDRRLPLWAVSGLVGAIAGWAMLMSAPGIAVRLASSLGGVAAIPLLSLPAFKKFLTFWASQQLELAPYFLAMLFPLRCLARDGRLSWKTCLPGLIFFLMAQASLAAFVLSPSTPYRAMTATYFYAVLALFALIVACQSSGQPFWRQGKAVLAAFCCLLVVSVSTQLQIFVEARPVTEAKLKALSEGKDSIRLYEYPRTNKYFFPGYDIREINTANPDDWRDKVPWDEAQALAIADMPHVSGIVSNNIVYLNGLPPGRVRIACVTHEMTVESLAQRCVRLFAAPTAALIPGQNALAASLKTFSAAVAGDGKAAVFARGILSLADVVYIGIENPGESPPFVWRRVSYANGSPATLIMRFLS